MSFVQLLLMTNNDPVGDSTLAITIPTLLAIIVAVASATWVISKGIYGKHLKETSLDDRSFDIVSDSLQGLAAGVLTKGIRSEELRVSLVYLAYLIDLQSKDNGRRSSAVFYFSQNPSLPLKPLLERALKRESQKDIRLVLEIALGRHR